MNNNRQNQDLFLKITCIISSIIKKWKGILLIIVICGMALDFYQTFTYHPQYSSSLNAVLKLNNNTYSQLEEARAYVKTLNYIFNGQVAKNYIIDKTGFENLDMTCTITSSDNTNIITMSTLSNSKQSAYYSLKYLIEWYSKNKDQYHFSFQIDVLENTPISEFPVNNNSHFHNLRKGMILSGLLVIAILALFEYLRDTIKSPNDIQNRLDARLFAKIPKERKPGSKTFWNRKKTSILITSLKTSFYYKESIKKLRNRFEESSKRHHYQSLMITSSIENEGKSSVAANLALALAKNKHKVLLIDGDIRKPSIHKIFELNTNKSLNLYLNGADSWENQVIMLPKTNLCVMCTKQNLVEAEKLISDEKMKILIEEAKQTFDYVIVDTSPAYDINEPLIINELVDASLLVVRQDNAPSKIINETISRIVNAKNNLIGIVYNARYVDLEKRSKVYGYRYGYSGYRRSERSE